MNELGNSAYSALPMHTNRSRKWMWNKNLPNQSSVYTCTVDTNKRGWLSVMVLDCQSEGWYSLIHRPFPTFYVQLRGKRVANSVIPRKRVKGIMRRSHIERKEKDTASITFASQCPKTSFGRMLCRSKERSYFLFALCGTMLQHDNAKRF